MLHYYRFKDALDLFRAGKTEEGRHALMELQARYIAMADELSTLRAQVQEYEDILYLARNLVFDGSCYWLITGALRQGPFCRDCYMEKGLLVRLQETDAGFYCPTCDRQLSQPGRAGKPRGNVIPFGR